MDYTKESQLPTPYQMNIGHRKVESKLKRRFPFLKGPNRPPAPLIWAAVVAVLIVIGGILYYVSTAAIKSASSTQQTITSNKGTTTPSAPTPSASELSHSYGIAAGGSLPDLGDTDLNARMAGIATTGAKWVRFDFKWSLIQPDNATDYQWSTYDKIVLAAQKYHLFVLGILDFTPGWARSSQCPDTEACQPADNHQFAKFAAAVAHRYKDHGLHYWEIWNEPNNPQFWQPKSNPSAYADMLKATAPAMRAEDSQSYLITAGLSPQATTDTSYSPVDFLTAVYKAGAKDSFDAVADHPYTFPLSPKDTSTPQAWVQMAASKSSLRQIMVSNNDSNKKMWITEFGSPTGGPGAVATVSNPNLSQHPYSVDDGLQSKILSDAIGLYKSYDWVGPFFYYSYQDAGTTQDTNENFFGLIRADGSKKPAYQTFQSAAQSAQ